MALLDIAIFVATLIGIWIIVSIPVYISAKILTGGRIRLAHAMGATALGPIVYAGVTIVAIAVLGTVLGAQATIPALILAFIAWLWVYKSMFKTGWAKAFGIAILAFIVFIALVWIVSVVVGIVIPGQETGIPNPFSYLQA